jgi:hypothetical protein
LTLGSFSNIPYGVNTSEVTGIEHFKVPVVIGTQLGCYAYSQGGFAAATFPNEQQGTVGSILGKVIPQSTYSNPVAHHII